MSDPRRILLVEDHEQLRASIKRALTFKSYVVLCATSVEQAVAVLAHGHADLLISDLSLATPTCGLDLARWVAAHQPGLPMLLMSGGNLPTSSSQLPDGAKPQALTLLAKPFSMSQLVHSIEDLLHRTGWYLGAALAAD